MGAWHDAHSPGSSSSALTTSAVRSAAAAAVAAVAAAIIASLFMMLLLVVDCLGVLASPATAAAEARFQLLLLRQVGLWLAQSFFWHAEVQYRTVL